MEGGPNHVGKYCSAPFIADLEHDRLIYNSSYYYLDHFARFIRPGAERILCGNTETEILKTAFLNVDGTIAVVTLNEQEYPTRSTLKIGEVQAEAISPERSMITLVLDRGVRTASSVGH